MAEKKGLFSRFKNLTGVFGGTDEREEHEDGEVLSEGEAQEQPAAEAEAAPEAEAMVVEAAEAAPAAVEAPPKPKKAAAKKAPAKKAPAKKASAKKAAAKKAAAKKAAAKKAVREVHIPDESVDIRAVRDGMDMTQAEFAKAFGFSIHTLRKWEQGVREPEKPTRILLMMIRDRPEFVKSYLKEISVGEG